MRKFFIILAFFFLLFFPFWFIQYLAFIVLIVVAFSFIYSRVIYHNIHITRSMDIIRAYKNKIIDIDLEIKNNSLLPVHYISVFDRPGKLSVAKTPKFIFSLGAKEKKRVSYTIQGMKRGEYSLGPIIVKSGDPLGLFPWELTIKNECTVIIFPTITRIMRRIRNGYPGGNIKVSDKMYEDVTRLKSIREYIPGDDIRYISWKVSAHLGALYTREYLQSLHSPALLALNLTLDDFPVKYRYTHLEKAVGVCASLAVFFINLKQEVGFISSGLIYDKHPHIRMGGGHGHVMLILENLAVIRGSTGPVDIINLVNNSHINVPNGTRIILISPALSERRIQAFASIRRKRMFLEYIPVTEEKTKQFHPNIKTFSLSRLEGEVLYV